MAGDWIKMRADLRTHPKVVRVSSDLKTDRLRVIGAFFVAWTVFDAHTSDGRLEGYTPEVLDVEVGLPGFALALMRVGWLFAEEVNGVQTLVVPRFSEHNGQSAKKRITDTERKRESRSGPDSIRKGSDMKSDKSGTREEKRREEKETHTAGASEAGGGAGVCVLGEIPEPEDTSPAAMAWRAIQAAGVRDAPLRDPQVAALLQRGVTADQLGGAAAMAAARGKGLAYAIGIVQNQLAAASGMAEGPAAIAVAWDSGRSSIEATGERLGEGRWDEAAAQLGKGETFTAYTARVRQAVQACEAAHAH
ncbi:MAG: hypothetical protein EOO27_04745 [Comamonadaceae bacterium]|nr:MAG: hypothetical protein EOO27_04745 [Comamonadaceae bacterium]